MTTCGEKHTLLLDEAGNIWFAGQLMAVGLDAADNDKRSKFVMLSTLSKRVPSEPMLYISTGQNHNLSLSGTNKVYSFGKNDYCKCGSRLEDESVFFKEVPLEGIPSVSIHICRCRRLLTCRYRWSP
eukprot:TRINITY_DN19543_c0_g1_i1.p1 TRINITY_DN19543_c0_g1~~TRINITY_DN19543_c0_g1_i1.p1  ORF type:complete len:127 (+),score=21.62 TRINITY_DN19543_c0_g1_i1:204-584(+)